MSMIYFKKVDFGYADKAVIETTFRKSAIKRNRLIELETSKSDIGTDKIFFGYENNKALYFIRIKSTVEFFLPNIILVVTKDETIFCYKFRLSILASLAFLVLCIILISSLLGAISDETNFWDFATIFSFFLAFLVLCWIELRITMSRIKKAFKNQSVSNY
jgi:uncharacterized membrane protein